VWKVGVQAITVPAARSLLAPLRSTRVTVPEVVGFHLRERGWPAVAEKLVGILKGFAFCANANNGAPTRRVRMNERGENIFAAGQEYTEWKDEKMKSRRRQYAREVWKGCVVEGGEAEKTRQ